MIPDLAYTSKDFYVLNQIKSKFIYLLSNLDTIGLYTKGFYHPVNVLTSIESIINPIILTKAIFI